MAESVVNAVFLRSRPGKEDELADRLATFVKVSRSAPGVIIFDLHRSTEDRAFRFLYERYESQEHPRPSMPHRRLIPAAARSNSILISALATTTSGGRQNNQ